MRLLSSFLVSLIVLNGAEEFAIKRVFGYCKLFLLAVTSLFLPFQRGALRIIRTRKPGPIFGKIGKPGSRQEGLLA